MGLAAKLFAAALIFVTFVLSLLYLLHPKSIFLFASLLGWALISSGVATLMILAGMKSEGVAVLDINGVSLLMLAVFLLILHGLIPGLVLMAFSMITLGSAAILERVAARKLLRKPKTSFA